ncbi:hypothetical protein [Agrobacterium larrymoorei]|uniref:hypothetical protein n=1 Tax=Agrobacterium larrymoorei TaxID=160699 RepID=UPI0030C147A1
MADFSPPFANDGERRAPASDEQQLGFGCGQADQFLFNWMFWSIQSEIGAVIEEAGLTPSNTDMTQLLQAIQSLIDAATGGGGDPNYVLMTQARTRLPIFPEILTGNGKMGVTSPGVGQVRVPAGVNFLHRGIFNVTTVQTDLVTDASKTYHLRWSPTAGFALKDLANTGYNPTVAAETNIAFDSTYDDMLVARVITNSSNVVTVTDLVNKSSLGASGEVTFTNLPFQDDKPPSQITNYTTVNIDWSRIPFTAVQAVTDSPSNAEWNFGTRPLSRYQIAVYSQSSVSNNGEWVGWQAWR